MKDENGKDIVYFVGRSAGVCPKCLSWNAMLDVFMINGDLREKYFECRDCGYLVSKEDCVRVSIGQDVKNREFTGVASDGTVVSLASFDGNGLYKYLKAYPTPDKW